MRERTFISTLCARWSYGNYLCVGLDTDLEAACSFFGQPMPGREEYDEGRPGYVYNGRFPEQLIRMNSGLIAATSYVACAYKVNPAFYLAYGYPGMDCFERTVGLVPRDVPIIVDWKIGEVRHAVSGYAKALGSWLPRPLAVTVSPYVGAETIEDLVGLGIFVFVLCRTSNDDAAQVQELVLRGGQPLYLEVARLFTERWGSESVGLVVGATQPRALATVREHFPDSIILAPGFGEQGGQLDDLAAGVSGGPLPNLIPSTSRALLSVSRDAARFPEDARGFAYSTNLQLRQAIGHPQAE